MIKILYAEDDAMLSKTCVEYLSRAGYEVIHAADGDAALKLYKGEKPDVVLLDVLMPGKTGFEVARAIREENLTVPILYISSLTNSQHAIEGFRTGANDYIRKETLLEEIAVRIEACLAQAGHRESEANFVKITDDISLDVVSRSLIIDGKETHLSPMEARIMKILFVNRGHYVPKEKLVEAGWGNTFKESFRYLDKVLVGLRKIIHADCSVEIATSWGQGYGLMQKKRPAREDEGIG